MFAVAGAAIAWYVQRMDRETTSEIVEMHQNENMAKKKNQSTDMFSISLDSLPRSNHVVLSSQASLQDVLDRMLRKRCHEAVIVEDGQYVGLLDMTDATMCLVQGKIMPISSHKTTMIMREFEYMHVTDTLQDLLVRMISGERRIVLKKEANKISLISQRVVIQYVYAMTLDTSFPLEDIVFSSLECLGLARKPKVISVPEITSAKMAFRKMLRHNITSIPVLDTHGKIVSVLSMTDIRVLSCKETDDQYRTDNMLEGLVVPFIERARKYSSETLQEPCIRAHQVITCKPDIMLSDAIALMVNNHVHHIYVVEKQVPIGIVSFADILHIMLKSLKNDLKVDHDTL